MSKPVTSTNRKAVYQRQWREKNIEHAREIERASQERRKAADPVAFREAARQRYEKWLSSGDNAARERSRRRYGEPHYGSGKRRGLTMAMRHAYWEWRAGLCDFCGKPCNDPAVTGAWKMTVVDHDRAHHARPGSIGCIECVRGQGHRPCNVAEGVIQRSLAQGTGVTGPLVDYLADPPFQRWRREAA